MIRSSEGVSTVPVRNEAIRYDGQSDAVHGRSSCTDRGEAGLGTTGQPAARRRARDDIAPQPCTRAPTGFSPTRASGIYLPIRRHDRNGAPTQSTPTTFQLRPPKERMGIWPREGGTRLAGCTAPMPCLTTRRSGSVNTATRSEKCRRQNSRYPVQFSCAGERGGLTRPASAIELTRRYGATGLRPRTAPLRGQRDAPISLRWLRWPRIPFASKSACGITDLIGLRHITRLA